MSGEATRVTPTPRQRGVLVPPERVGRLDGQRHLDEYAERGEHHQLQRLVARAEAEGGVPPGGTHEAPVGVDVLGGDERREERLLPANRLSSHGAAGRGRPGGGARTSRCCPCQWLPVPGVSRPRRGIVRYLEEHSDGGWYRGSNLLFDPRRTQRSSAGGGEVVGECIVCSAGADSFIFAIQPSASGDEFTRAGSSVRASFTSTTSANTGTTSS